MVQRVTYEALVPGCSLVAEDVVSSTEHHHVREVVAKAQEPEAHRVLPMGALTIPQRGPRFRGALLPLGIRQAPLPGAGRAVHDIKVRSPEGSKGDASSESASMGRVRVFKSS